MTRRVRALVLAAPVAAVALAGCQNNAPAQAKSTGPRSPGTVPTSLTQSLPAPQSPKFPQRTVGMITTTWTTFFNGKTAFRDRVRLLQNGSQFEPYLQQHGNDSAVRHLAAHVSKVTFVDDRLAKVTYTLSDSGKPVVQGATGEAVLRGPYWLVSDKTFCQVVTRYGQPKPRVCP